MASTPGHHGIIHIEQSKKENLFMEQHIWSIILILIGIAIAINKSSKKQSDLKQEEIRLLKILAEKASPEAEIVIPGWKSDIDDFIIFDDGIRGEIFSHRHGNVAQAYYIVANDNRYYYENASKVIKALYVLKTRKKISEDGLQKS